MRRREFLSVLSGAAAAWPLAVHAQHAGRTYRLAFFTAVRRDTPQMLAFFDELSRSGFIEGQNLEVIPDGFEVRNEQLTKRAATVVKAAPDAIITGTDPYVRAAQQATQTIPLIAMTEDMVAAKLVTSLARPGGNTTGISLLSPELDGKRQDILIEAVPGLRRMAALADSSFTNPQHLQELQRAAQTRGIGLSVFAVENPEEIVPAINNAKAMGAEALNVLAAALFSVNRRTIFERVVALRMPAIYQWPEMAEEGGFAGYGPRLSQVYRQRAQFVVKVLRGARPADLPVEQPTTFELVVNLKTAKSIGYEIPAGLVLRADKVIE